MVSQHKYKMTVHDCPKTWPECRSELPAFLYLYFMHMAALDVRLIKCHLFVNYHILVLDAVFLRLNFILNSIFICAYSYSSCTVS